MRCPRRVNSPLGVATHRIPSIFAEMKYGGGKTSTDFVVAVCKGATGGFPSQMRDGRYCPTNIGIALRLSRMSMSIALHKNGDQDRLTNCHCA